MLRSLKNAIGGHSSSENGEGAEEATEAGDKPDPSDQPPSVSY